MDRALSHQEERESTQRCHKHLKICLHVLKPRNPPKSFAFSVSTFRVPKSLRNLCSRAKCSNGFCFARLQFTGMVVNNAVYCASPCFLMEGGSEGMGDGFGGNGREIEEFGGAIHEEHRESSSSSDFLASSEATVNEEACSSYGDSSSSPSTAMAMAWSIRKNDAPHVDKRKLEKQGSFSSCLSEVEMMKERFSKLLLGEDMSGCGNGVCTALAISNAITNLCATLFGQIWRLEPLPPEKKTMWRREMDMLLCVSDHIVELTPTWQTFPDGSKLEVMTCRPRSDLYVNLPALRKLDNMLLEILDGFENTEFWYVDQGIQAPEKEGSCSFRQPFPRQEEKWWLPVPRVPNGGLSESSRKHLQYKRDSTNQILKAALAINSIALADMAVPDSYLESLPKNGRASLGDLIHRYITSEQFSPECLLDCLDLSSEHQALEIANRVEASIFVWRRRTGSKSTNSTGRSNSRSSWEMVKDLVIDGDKREVLADRAETLLLSLKQKFPGLPQTTLDMSKIQYNKDVGKSILESYSRVLESLAFNIVARIDDLFYVDDLTRHSDQFLSLANLGSTKFSPIPLSGTPYKTAFATPSFSPSITTNLIISPKTGERSSTLSENLKLNHHGFGVKKVLTDYLSIDSKGKGHFKRIERSDSLLSTTGEASTSECSDEGLSPETYDLIVK